jgi:hypothetical protein
MPPCRSLNRVILSAGSPWTMTLAVVSGVSDEIAGISLASAYVILVEIGTNRSTSPPQAHEVAGTHSTRHQRIGGKVKARFSSHGNAYLAPSWPMPPRLRPRLRQLHPRHHRAPAVRPTTQFHDLGPDSANRRRPERRNRNHIRHMGTLGYKVTIQRAA